MRVINIEHTFTNGKFRNKTIEHVIQSNNTKYLNYFLKQNDDIRFDKQVLKLAQASVDLKFNKKMIDILNYIKSDTSKALLEMNGRLVKSIFTNVKAFATKKDSISFDTPFTSNKDNTIKIGRFVKKLFELNDIAITDIAVEEFTTSFYAFFSVDKNLEIKLVKGEEIRRLYDVENYHANSGSLGNSCMRHSQYAPLFDLYAKNKDVSMLVLMNKATNKITARAIIWENTTFTYKKDDVKLKLKTPFMDRVYTNSNKHVKVFFEHAKASGWIYKKQQSYSNKEDFIYNDTGYKGRMVAHLKVVGDSLPYLDTMAFRSKTPLKLTNGYTI